MTLNGLRAISTSSLPAFLVALVGGFIFAWMGMPLPWTLGPIALCATLAIMGSPWLMSGQVMQVARPAIGVMVGSAFTPEIATSLVTWWKQILFVLAFSMTLSACGYLLFRHIFKFDRVTAFIGGLPAGLAELTVIGGALGGNLRALVLIHSIRIVTVVFTVPLFLTFVLGLDISARGAGPEGQAASSVGDWAILIGCGIGGVILSRFLHLPGGVMITALVLSAVVHGTGLSSASLPFWTVALAQIFIGSVMGARFANIAFSEMRSALAAALAWVVVLAVLTLAAAWLATILFDGPMHVALLSLAPGGMAEMAIVTYSLGFDVAFIMSCQVARMFFLLTLSPFVAARLGRNKD
jgi:uncharacterized protein